MRRTSLRLAACGLWLLLTAPLAAQAPVRVLSFNIRYGTADDGAHAWPARRERVMATIGDHAPHLLGVQEALDFQLREILAAHPHYRLVGVGRDDGATKGEYSAILVDTTRFTVVAEGTFWYSDTPTVPGSMGWGNRITRIATWTRVADRATGDTIHHVNTHWDHESQPSREQSAAALLAHLAARPGAQDLVLVTGDLNADETNAAARALVAAARTSLRSAFRTIHPHATEVGTFHGFTGTPSTGMIDVVLVGPRWRVHDAGIDRRRFGDGWASDHWAVFAVVSRGS